MLKCQDIFENAEEHLSEKLTTWQSVKFRLHLAVCSNCRRYLKHLKLTRQVSQHTILSTQHTDKQVEDVWTLLRQEKRHD